MDIRCILLKTQCLLIYVLYYPYIVIFKMEIKNQPGNAFDLIRLPSTYVFIFDPSHVTTT